MSKELSSGVVFIYNGAKFESQLFIIFLVKACSVRCMFLLEINCMRISLFRQSNFFYFSSKYAYIYKFKHRNANANYSQLHYASEFRSFPCMELCFLHHLLNWTTSVDELIGSGVGISESSSNGDLILLSLRNIRNAVKILTFPSLRA